MRVLIVFSGLFLFAAHSSAAILCKVALDTSTQVSSNTQKQYAPEIQKTLTDYADFYLGSSNSKGLGLELISKLEASVSPGLLGQFFEMFMASDQPTRTYLLHSLAFIYKSQRSTLELSLSPYGVQRPENQIKLFLNLSESELVNQAHKAIDSIPELKHQVMNLPLVRR